MLEAKEVYGLIVIDRKEATLGLLEGKQIRVLRKLSSGVPGKVKAGGQSAARFERLTDEIAKEFYRRVSDHAKELFYGLDKLKGIFLGGPGPTKDDWLKEGQLLTVLQKKIVAIKDIGYTDEQGLLDLVESSKEELANEAITKEKKILDRFFTTLGGDQTKAAYGIEQVEKALTIGAVEVLIISTSFDKVVARDLEEKARNIAAETIYVSVDTTEGIQFSNLKGGVGAILRFAVH